MDEVTTLFADKNGDIHDAPGFFGAGRTGDEIVRLTPGDLTPLPKTADIMYLPGRRAVGYGRDGRLREAPGLAVAASLPAGYTRIYLPAFRRDDASPMLPLYGYTAVALYRGRLFAAAMYTDENDKWDPARYNTRALRRLIKRMRERFPKNRIVEHLAKCSLRWHCCTAENLFYRRWEMGLPMSPRCNARCLGCISLQDSGCCPAPQGRIAFSPTANEAGELALYHLSVAPDAIVSFGQGCEGEPSLAADRISECIRKVREATRRGQINMNTNAGFTGGVRRIVDAGLDSMRVSMISARDASYLSYYRAGYGPGDVKESIRYALSKGVYVSINLLYFPGFTDSDEEMAAWTQFVRDYPVQMVQIRNLNIDPDYFLREMPPIRGRAAGAKDFIGSLLRAHPALVVGNFSHYTGGRSS